MFGGTGVVVGGKTKYLSVLKIRRIEFGSDINEGRVKALEIVSRLLISTHSRCIQWILSTLPHTSDSFFLVTFFLGMIHVSASVCCIGKTFGQVSCEVANHFRICHF